MTYYRLEDFTFSEYLSNQYESEKAHNTLIITVGGIFLDVLLSSHVLYPRNDEFQGKKIIFRS